MEKETMVATVPQAEIVDEQQLSRDVTDIEFQAESLVIQTDEDYAFAGEFVGDYISMCVDAPSQVTIGAMCGAEALLVPGERLETFYRTDAACERLGRRLAEHMLAEVYERLLDRYAASPQQRYEALTERCPDVLQLVPLRELASYLGVRPETLSRIRRRVR